MVIIIIIIIIILYWRIVSTICFYKAFSLYSFEDSCSLVSEEQNVN